ncbi:GTP-binding protein [Butyrivibrio sp. AE3004]|uniref:GTP-binding protein n=1 Tax=Butyrivibrio sp. AE3004 TaxID=1506994 RepID=UPI00068A028D|nr:GTP-binding protein [Butyrivibrio sp. AE3004]
MQKILIREKNMVKIDLITGFLGSGKTTFIKEYAKYLLSKGEKICIIENDYGAVNIDMVLLQDLFGDNCNLEMIVGGDGQEAHRRRFRTKLISMGMSGYDRVIIEPSGIYDVDEFFDVLYDEPLDRWYEIGNVISIVDSGTVTKLFDMSRYIFMSEIACAGKLVISKLVQGFYYDDKGIWSECSGTSLNSSKTKELLKSINTIMSDFNTGISFTEKDIVAKPFLELTDRDFEEIENCGYRHASYVKLPLSDREFTPLFYFDVEMSKEELMEKTAKLFADEKAGHIIRIKGFVKTGENSQAEINATREKTQINPVISSRNVLIIIGENLNREYINEALKDYCSVVSL